MTFEQVVTTQKVEPGVLFDLGKIGGGTYEIFLKIVSMSQVVCCRSSITIVIGVDNHQKLFGCLLNVSPFQVSITGFEVVFVP